MAEKKIIVGSTWNANKNPCFSVSKKDPNKNSVPSLEKSNMQTNPFPKKLKNQLKKSKNFKSKGFKIKNASKN